MSQALLLLLPGLLLGLLFNSEVGDCIPEDKTSREFSFL
jgi:hypothetical protein